MFAAIFPGQGSQSVGMMKDLYQSSSKIRELYKIASSVLDYDLWELTVSDPSKKLNDTVYTQPASLLLEWHHGKAIFHVLIFCQNIWQVTV